MAQAAKKPTAQDPISVARESYQCYVRKDRATLETLIAPNFHFTSPLDNRIDRRTYFERCWPNSETTESFDEIHLAAHGEQVFITYEGHSTKGNIFRNTEVLTIRNGQIVEAEVYFGWSIPHKAKPGGFVDEQAQ